MSHLKRKRKDDKIDVEKYVDLFNENHPFKKRKLNSRSEKKESLDGEERKIKRRRMGRRAKQNQEMRAVLPSLSDGMILERRNERKLKVENRDKLVASHNIYELMQMIVENLMGNQYSWPFMYPVDAIELGVPNYYDVIDNPMDLTTAMEKVKNKKYGNEEEFANDIRLICNNAMIFNPPDSPIYKFAEMMKSDFEKMITVLRGINNKETESLKSSIQNEMEMKKKDLELAQKDLSDLNDIKNELDLENSKIPLIKLSKLKYTSPSYEERMRLYELFQKLDPIYMRGINDIIKEEMPAEMRKSGDEIRLNLDKMENITIRKLESYILACLGRQNEDIKENIENVPKEIKPVATQTQPIEKEKITSPIPIPPQEIKGTIDSNINNSPQTIEPDLDESSESQSSSSESDDSSSSSEDEGNDQLFISPTNVNSGKGGG
jgi:hypothetical protein